MTSTSQTEPHESRFRAPKRIVVGTDFTPPSEAALEYAINLARALGASVHVVNAFELPLMGVPDGTLGISPDFVAKILEDAERSLEVVARAHRREDTGVALSTSVEQADARVGVITAAERLNADLIVIGTHGRRGLSRALIGSVAEAIVRRSTIPVLTIHRPAIEEISK